MANTIGTQAAPGNTYADPGIYYDRRFLERVVPQLYLKDMGDKKPLPTKSGTMIKWHRLQKLVPAVTPLSENTNPSDQNVATDVVSVEPLTYGAWVKVSAELNLKSINPIVEEILDELADQAAISYDRIAFAAIHGNFQNQFAGGAANEAAVADTSVLNAAELRKAVYKLRSVTVNSVHASVPGFEGNLYKAVIDPASEFDLLSDTAVGSFIDISKYKRPEEILKGEVGQLYGTRIVTSTNLPTGTGATAATYRAFVFGRQAYGITELSGQGIRTIRQPAGSNNDPLEMFTTLGWKFMMAAKVLHSVRAVEIYAGSAADN
jgi:N4-gp56 family major capsid protein